MTALELPAASNAATILGETDALKLRSCMTLFHNAWSDEPVFGQVLDQYFAGQRDGRTEHLIAFG